MPARCRAGESKCKEMRSWASSGPRNIRILWLAWQKKESGGYFSVLFHSSLYLQCSRQEPERELRKSLHKGKSMDISWYCNTSLLCDFQLSEQNSKTPNASSNHEPNTGTNSRKEVTSGSQVCPEDMQIAKPKLTGWEQSDWKNIINGYCSKETSKNDTSMEVNIATFSCLAFYLQNMHPNTMHHK